MASSSFFSASDKSFSAAGNIPSSSSSIWWMYRSFIVRKRVGQPVEAHLVEFGRQFAVAIMIGLEPRDDSRLGCTLPHPGKGVGGKNGRPPRRFRQAAFQSLDRKSRGWGRRG